MHQTVDIDRRETGTGSSSKSSLGFIAMALPNEKSLLASGEFLQEVGITGETKKLGISIISSWIFISSRTLEPEESEREIRKVWQ